MTRPTYKIALIFALMGATSLSALSTGFQSPEVPAFSRYQGILNRMPFGQPPAQNAEIINPIDAKTAAEAMKEQQLLARKINMSCVNITPAGTSAVGFTDLSVKPAANYYLLVGDDSNGWTVLDANYEEEWAELEKDGTAIYVKLGEGLMAEPPEQKVMVAKGKFSPNVLNRPTPAKMPAKLPISRTAQRPSLNPIAERIAKMQNANNNSTNSSQKENAIKSYIDRLRERKQLEKTGQESEKRTTMNQLEEIARKIAKEELDKSQRETEIRLLEQGIIPAEEIQLTSEEDAALANQ